MDTIAAGTPAAAPLPVRRADLAGERHVAALLREALFDTPEAADLIRHQRVLVLSGLTLPAAAPPLAAAAFSLHRRAGTAQLASIVVRPHLRRRPLSRRLLTGALTWLRQTASSRCTPSLHQAKRARCC